MLFGDFNFWDYVIVEGTKDGFNWKPLINGYDCRTDSVWLNTFLASGEGDSTMFINHILNLQSSFNAGDTIIIRFRLLGDETT